MTGFKIEMLKAPANPTGYEVGTTLTYGEGATHNNEPTRLLVVGEDDLYLHTFHPDGAYYGILKAEANLNSVRPLPTGGSSNVD